MHNWAGVGWGRRSTDHSLLILAQASRFKHVPIVQLGPSTGSWPADASNWRPRISQPSLKRPDLYFVIHRNNATEKVFFCSCSALFLFFPCMIPYFVRPARRTRGFAKYPKFSYPQKIQVSKISNPTKSFKSPRHLNSLAPRRGHG